ncbi:PAAR domain-containing protein [Cystobacter fuscus]|uniref:PAAR domain-containing protein n=1 Tax=Cystobacter fuscus TaxID=43 RepID=UPI0037BE92A2
MPPAARISDMHVCPKVEPGPVPHVGGPTSSGESTVIIGGMPAARIGDSLVCFGGPPDSISQGESTVIIGGKPAARLGDGTSHGGVLVMGCPTVIIGSSAQAQTVVVAARDGTPFCEECEKRRRAQEQAQRDAQSQTEAPDASASSSPSPEPVTPQQRQGALDRLLESKVNPAQAEKTLELATLAGVAREVVEVVNSGKLENLLGLKRFLTGLHAERKDVNNPRNGKFEQLKEVHRRAMMGHEVALEGRKQQDSDARSGQADVIDHTSMEAIQMKSVTGASLNTFLGNLQSAVDQLGGAGGEKPPVGYQRVAEVRLAPTSTLYQQDRQELLGNLRGRVNNLDNLHPKDITPGVVRIVNQHGTHTFSPDELK